MRRYLKGAGIAAILLGLAVSGPAGAQDAKDKKDTNGPAGQGITREQADSILNELRQIRQLLEKLQPQPPARTTQPEKATLTISGGYSLGRSDAPLTMVEFTDFQCPFCRQFHLTAFEEIKRNYIDTGKLRFISHDFPLDFHQNALRAALAGRCAGEQDKFWPMRHLLIANANNLGPEAVLNYAQQLSLDMNRFRACVDTQKYLPDVQREIREAEAIGVSATPSFVLGKTTKEGVEGFKVVGAQPFAAFDSRLKELLAPNP